MATTEAAGAAESQASTSTQPVAEAKATKTKKPAAPSAPQQAQRRTQTSRPEYRHELMLKSIQAQRVFERTYQTMAYSLFSVEVILRIMGEKPEAVDAVAKLVDSRIATVSQQLEEAGTALIAKAKETGLNVNPTYSQPVKVVAAISTPQAGKVAQMMRRLDDMMSIIDMLWLNSEMSGEDRTAEQHRWERRFYSLAGFLFNLQARAREEAKRRGKGEEVHEEAPEPAPEHTAQEVADEAKIAAKDKDGSSLIPVGQDAQEEPALAAA
ncbi:MAG: hypothetical protein E7K47_00550 [Acidovorax sp.]|nr:hypothetical protein [Acidovorax sp.]TFI42377.1 hypothetical protein E4O93_22400 [Diaphorobacter sp. DS2]